MSAKSTTKTGSRPAPAVASSSNSSASPESVPKVTRIVFTALLLDILAFTIILPLFPRLLQFYRDSEHGDQTSLLAWSLSRLTEFQSAIGLNDAKTPTSSSIKRPPKMDIVLLGGALGSLFSVLQFIASPVIGKLSDVLGRRRVLLISMLGNLISCAVWLFSSTFELFVLSRIIGGLSEGNVQLSIAMISDITTPATRSKGLAMVGIAFAIAFTIGPALGAYFANKDLVAAWPGLAQYGLHPFSGSALLALVLLTVESLYLYAKLPETNSESWRLAVQQTVQQETTDASSGSSSSSSTPVTKGSTATTTKSASTSSSTTAALDQEKIQALQQSYLSVLSFTHFAHLFLFSGMEFTLTFLTFHLFDFSHMQQGALLGYIGILSSLLQGGYVRRRAHIVGEKRMVLQGMVAAAIGLGSIALVSGGGGATTTLLGEKSILFPGYVIDAIEWLDTQEWSRKTRMWGLYAGATGLAVTSATVVNCLTSLASLVCDMGSNDALPTPTSTSTSTTATTTTTKKQTIGKGLALGRFRSWGQLGRAAGPIAACSLYWRVGPLVCYGAASAAVFAIAFLSSRILPEVRKLPIRTRAATTAASTKKTK
ncbi:major facilitator superfamily domain-containing protein [Linnemannia elongata]|nr:major facilitator superfamily domain-containing protein [Linnemannia elongata]